MRSASPTTDRSRLRDPRVVGAAAAALVVTAAVAAGGEVAEADRAVARAIYDLPTALTGFLEAVNTFGTRLAIGVVALVALVCGRARAAVVVLGAGWLAWAVAAGLKELVDRPRPDPALLDRPIRVVVDGFGFPSSHAAISFALAGALALAAGSRWVSVSACVAAILTAVTRVHLGVHWPLDVVGGAAIGLLAAVAADAVIQVTGRALERRGAGTAVP